MADTDAHLSDHEWRLKMAAEGKAIYIPSKTAEQMKAKAAAEAKRLAQLSARTITLTVEEWRTIDTAIPDVIEMLDDIRNMLADLACTGGLDRGAINSMMRLAARAVQSTEDKEVLALDRLDSSIRRAGAREEEERRQTELKGGTE